MDEDPAALPDFDNPPIVEALASVEFENLGIGTLDLASLVRGWVDTYPVLSEHEALPPTSAFGPTAPPFQFMWNAGAPAVRYWAASEDDQWLAQLQADRVVLNWRQTSPSLTYPHFDAVRERLTALLADLAVFLQSLGRPSPNLLLAEYTYVNHIEADTADYLFSIFKAPSRPLPGEELYTGFRVVRELLADEGRAELTIAAEPAPTPERMIGLNVTTRVFLPPNSELTKLDSAIQLAHRTSREGFTAVTSREMHQRWGRNIE